MLDADTRKRIDKTRDILVGKISDPKAQVEQITTALIYKFMDDMDRESEKLGGNAKFFANDFSEYSWSNLLDKKLSGVQRIDLYTRAISNIPRNEEIPYIFRSIFKDARLPYKDPVVLHSFLKEINFFTYDDSENLGDAFEYLLSVLGSQGNAGQFRTPRHIIDFMVEVLDPRKDESILDPACGTAGFLISSYKYIVKYNSSRHKLKQESNDKKTTKRVTSTEVNTQKALLHRGDLLTPNDKNMLMDNIVGYDISPDMVKLSLVNMYLHDFPQPQIYEYDTLTSENRWDEKF